MELYKTNSSLAAPIEFAWKDRNNEYRNVSKMATRHLFYVLRMIWNHKMPGAARLHPIGQQYVLGSFYTDTYLKSAIRFMTIELVTRKDLTDTWKADLQKMYYWVGRNQIEGVNNVRID